MRSLRSLGIGHGGRRHRGRVGRAIHARGGHRGARRSDAAIATARGLSTTSTATRVAAGTAVAAMMPEDVQQATAMAATLVATAAVAAAGRFASWRRTSRFTSRSSTGRFTSRGSTSRLASRLSAAILLASATSVAATVVKQAPQPTEQVVAMAGLDAPVVAAALHVAFAAAVTPVTAVTVTATGVAAAGRLAGWRTSGCGTGRLTSRLSAAGWLSARWFARLLTTLWLATIVAAAVIQAEHAVQELEAEALAAQAYADYQRAEKHVPFHRATSPFTSRTRWFACLNRDRHDTSADGGGNARHRLNA